MSEALSDLVIDTPAGARTTHVRFAATDTIRQSRISAVLDFWASWGWVSHMISGVMMAVAGSMHLPAALAGVLLGCVIVAVYAARLRKREYTATHACVKRLDAELRRLEAGR